jgi:hypothetical protein
MKRKFNRRGFLKVSAQGAAVARLVSAAEGFLLFWLIGFFDVHEEPIGPLINNKTLLKGGFGNGECQKSRSTSI